ncbi:MAG TPA: glycosyltransferase family 4 protein [Chthonomonadales bacterium]|nr:glycosyltransferase family 4 protein [Chthonomonadales bacterium]
MPGILLVGNFLSQHGFTPSVNEELSARLRGCGWEVLTTSTRLNRASRLATMVAAIVVRRSRYQVAQVDVFSGRAFLWAEVCAWALRRARRPYVLTLHGGALPEMAQAHAQRVRRLLSSASAVTAPSGYLHQRMRPYRDSIQLLLNPIDINGYTFRLRSRPSPDILWLRGVHRIYNPVLAPRMLARVLPAHPGARLWMVGPDKGDGSMQETQADAARLGVSDRVEFVGGVPKADVPQWLDRADLFLNTTNVDNTPVSVLEALASGLCVVSTNVGGLPYLLEDGVDALLTPPDDAGAMAHAVDRVLTEPGLAEALSRAARAKARLHDWSVVLPQWDALLRRAAEAGDR